jgi:hypothetical protein
MTTEALIPADAFLITPSDGVPLKEVAYGIRCDSAGTVKYETLKGNVFTDTVSAGETIIMQITKVWKTGTTDGMVIRGNRIN